MATLFVAVSWIALGAGVTMIIVSRWQIKHAEEWMTSECQRHYEIERENERLKAQACYVCKQLEEM